ncbi:MAG: tRNA-dihydrouridine synthase family protein [Muribaculaceae bacterium]|nr:tRNA-dihydrouridine synthase family protein [Muribaculaceae bacterium]
MEAFELYIAPVQGHTDAAWRKFHREVYGRVAQSFTPFIRLEKGDPRRRDMADFTSPLNADDPDLEPQVIFRDMDELAVLLTALRDAGASRVNLNLGCPFPLQTAKGRGAAILDHPDCLDPLPEIMARFPEISLSVKMRLGLGSPDQWRPVLDRLRYVPLRHIAVHPRTAREQYSGPLHLDQFSALMHSAPAPVIYNGEIHTPADIEATRTGFPAIAGVMCARGLLRRPSLFSEYIEGREWDAPKRLEHILRFHSLLFEHYNATLCGPSQILSKIKPFWEYAEPEIGHKAAKAIRKATTLPKYAAAISMIAQ